MENAKIDLNTAPITTVLTVLTVIVPTLDAPCLFLELDPGYPRIPELKCVLTEDSTSHELALLADVRIIKFISFIDIYTIAVIYKYFIYIIIIIT